MNISKICVAGFRGVRGRIELDVPSGFLVVTGRNGSGKSSICDAIEYALTGTLSKYSEGTEKGESVSEYIWWRGRDPAPEHYVSVVFNDLSGREFEVTRRPNGVRINGEEATGKSNLESYLCVENAAPADALAQLCRTTIIRDETLASYSVDLEETRRFLFVKSALGTDALDLVEKHIKDLMTEFRKEKRQAEDEYQETRDAVSRLHGQLSEARAQAEQAGDVHASLKELRTLTQSADAAEGELVRIARSLIADTHRSIDSVDRLAHEAAGLRSELERLNSPERQDQEKAILQEIAAATDLIEKQQEHEQEHLSMAPSVADRSAIAEGLAQLHKHGRVVGRIDDGCPLCSSPISEQDYRVALDLLASEIDASAKAVGRWEEQRDRLQDALRASVAHRDGLQAQLNSLRSESEHLTAEVAAFEVRAKTFINNLTTELSSVAFDDFLNQEREKRQKLERAVSLVEASAAIERVVELDRTVAEAQEKSDDAEARLRRIGNAERKAKELLSGIRRAVGELVEERLASLEPLLKNLYSRLRPHTEWDDVQYHLRGEVRRFLSLKVGENVNPRFTFSSGQRRAIGLAFLLAVYLSRPWCRLLSLVLDDPIQHIDDFRALHLAEVLASIRRGGQQIICTVEDPALADLLCRRLRTDGSHAGALLHMAYGVGEGAYAARLTNMAPAAARFVLSA